jgi:hypothetical protein
MSRNEYGCGKCHSTYNPETNSLTCPHSPFPKKCSNHSRFNCGNPECEEEAKRLETEPKLVSSINNFRKSSNG